MLDMLTFELVEGTAAFIMSCQTYEGGFSSASQPYFAPDGTLLPYPRPPLGEAHGGYTFCALASWVLLQPFLESRHHAPSPKPTIDLRNLLRWLTQMQGTEAELGGFKGRTNKLVDGCYSWWNGGAFALLEALGLDAGLRSAESDDESADDIPTHDESWDDIDGTWLSRQY